MQVVADDDFELITDFLELLCKNELGMLVVSLVKLLHRT